MGAQCSPFAAQRRAPAFVAIELAAQAAALLEALVRTEEGGDGHPHVGYLVGVSEARFARPYLPTEETSSWKVCLLGKALPVAKYAVTVTGPEGPVCQAVLSTHAGSPA